MRKTTFIGLLAAGLSVPLAAYAQAPQSPPPTRLVAPPTVRTTPPSEVSVFGLGIGQLLAIGVGAVIGGALFEVVLQARTAYLFGGATGAYLGYHWYTQDQSNVPDHR